MKRAEQTVRDLLYLDFEKASSIWSQFEEGLIERIDVTNETAKDRAAGTTLRIPAIAEANLGADYIQKRSTLQSKTLHHDVLNRVERRLTELSLTTDLSTQVSETDATPDIIRAALEPRPYLRASGWSVIEDYSRILAVSSKFNEIVDFLIKAAHDTMKRSPEYQELQKMLISARQAADKITDRNKKAAGKAQVAALQKQVDAMLEPKVANLDKWLLDGIQLWINTFMPTRINFRIYPFAACPSFQVLCNLKRECFVDQDLEHLLYGYGNRPSVPLSVFGLITALPPKDEMLFDPLKEFENAGELEKRVAFERSLRAIFGAMDEIEAFVRFFRYPNVTVHPIAVYRSFDAIER